MGIKEEKRIDKTKSQLAAEKLNKESAAAAAAAAAASSGDKMDVTSGSSLTSPLTSSSGENGAAPLTNCFAVTKHEQQGQVKSVTLQGHQGEVFICLWNPITQQLASGYVFNQTGEAVPVPSPLLTVACALSLSPTCSSLHNSTHTAIVSLLTPSLRSADGTCRVWGLRDAAGARDVEDGVEIPVVASVMPHAKYIGVLHVCVLGVLCVYFVCAMCVLCCGMEYCDVTYSVLVWCGVVL